MEMRDLSAYGAEDRAIFAVPQTASPHSGPRAQANAGRTRSALPREATGMACVPLKVESDRSVCEASRPWRFNRQPIPSRDGEVVLLVTLSNRTLRSAARTSNLPPQ
jgi:hypothetical protein